jgi:hypothetical protein
VSFKLVGKVGNSGVVLGEVLFSVDERLKVRNDEVAELVEVEGNEGGLDMGWWAGLA